MDPLLVHGPQQQRAQDGNPLLAKRGGRSRQAGVGARVQAVVATHIWPRLVSMISASTEYRELWRLSALPQLN